MPWVPQWSLVGVLGEKKPEEAGDTVGTTIVLFAVIGIAATVLPGTLCTGTDEADAGAGGIFSKSSSVCPDLPEELSSSLPIT